MFLCGGGKDDSLCLKSSRLRYTAVTICFVCALYFGDLVIVSRRTLWTKCAASSASSMSPAKGSERTLQRPQD